MRLDEGHDLPTLILGQPSPRRHAVVRLTVGDEPEQLAGLGIAHARRIWFLVVRGPQICQLPRVAFPTWLARILIHPSSTA